MTSDRSPCSAWPNSWKRVRASSKLGRGRRPLREVHDVDDDRADVAGEPFLASEGAHPGAAALGGSGEIVTDEDPDGLAVLAGDLPDADVRMIAGHVLQFREGEPEQAMGRLEGRFDDPVELEERLDGDLVEVVPRLAYSLGVIAPVPGLDGDVVALRLGLGLEGVALRGGAGARRRPDFVEEPSTFSGVLAMVSSSLKAAKVSKPRKPGAFRPEAHHLGDDGLVVGRAASVAAARPGHEGLLAQVAAAGEGEERLDARSGERDHVLAGKPLLLGRRGGGLPHGREAVRRDPLRRRGRGRRLSRRPGRSGRTACRGSPAAR